MPPTPEEINSLKLLIQNLHILSAEAKQHALNLLPKLNPQQLTRLKNKLLEIHQTLRTTYKKQNEEIEKFLHEKLNPMFKKAEQTSQEKEKQTLKTIETKLNNL